MKSILISVIIPIYNVQDYLTACVNSVLNQTYTNLEIILVDDGSTDLSGVICDRYAALDSRIKVIHKKNGGLVSARKKGLEYADGEYVTYVDGDDWIDENTYEQLISIGRYADIIAYGYYEEYEGYRVPKPNKIPEGYYSAPKELSKLYSKMLMCDNFFEFGISPSLCNKLIKREVLIENQKKVEDAVVYGEDAACIFPCIIDAESIFVSNLLCYHYRQRNGSIVRTNKPAANDNFIKIYHLLKKKFKKLDRKSEAMLNAQLKLYMWFLLLVKGYEKIQSGSVLFPYEKVKAGMKIAIYGLGGFGNTLRLYCEQKEHIEVAVLSDLHYESLRKQGIDVISIDEAAEQEFDIMLIAILNEELAVKIKDEMVSKGISEEKIDWIKEKALTNTKLPQWIENQD